MMTQDCIISKFQDVNGFQWMGGQTLRPWGLQTSICQNSDFRKFRSEYKLILLNLTVKDKNGREHIFCISLTVRDWIWTWSLLSCLFLLSVEGGELFDRIIDENYNLTEMDTISFIKQICKGIQYMHQMYILHLDLKVEFWDVCFVQWQMWKFHS